MLDSIITVWLVSNGSSGRAVCVYVSMQGCQLDY